MISSVAVQKPCALFVPKVVVAAWIAIFASGCGGASDSADGVTGLAGPDVTITAATTELYTVGSFAGEDWETFGLINWVDFDAQGRLYILDGEVNRVVVVGQDGRLVRIVGKQGGGPGELQQATVGAVLSDGRLVIFDFGVPGSFEVFDSTGQHEKSVLADMEQGAPRDNLLPLPDDRLVATDLIRIRMTMGGTVQGDGQRQSQRPVEIFSVVDSNGTLLGQARQEVLYLAWQLPPPEDVPDRNSQSSDGRRFSMRMNTLRAFSPELHTGVLSDGRIALVDSVGYRVKFIGMDGSVTGTLERPIAPLPVTEELREAIQAQNMEELDVDREVRGVPTSLSEQIGEMLRQRIENMTFAEEVPVIMALAVDDEDRLWIARSDENGSSVGPTDIATPGGDYIGTLEADGLRIPDAFGPNGLMAYVEEDELGIQTVRVVRLLGLNPG